MTDRDILYIIICMLFYEACIYIRMLQSTITIKHFAIHTCRDWLFSNSSCSNNLSIKHLVLLVQLFLELFNYLLLFSDFNSLLWYLICLSSYLFHHGLLLISSSVLSLTIEDWKCQPCTLYIPMHACRHSNDNSKPIVLYLISIVVVYIVVVLKYSRFSVKWLAISITVKVGGKTLIVFTVTPCQLCKHMLKLMVTIMNIIIIDIIKS